MAVKGAQFAFIGANRETLGRRRGRSRRRFSAGRAKQEGFLEVLFSPGPYKRSACTQGFMVHSWSNYRYPGSQNCFREPSVSQFFYKLPLTASLSRQRFYSATQRGSSSIRLYGLPKRGQSARRCDDLARSKAVCLPSCCIGESFYRRFLSCGSSRSTAESGA